MIYLEKISLKRSSSIFIAIAWLLLVTFLLCLPGSEFPTITWLNKIWFDKWVHIGLFLVLVAVWCRLYVNKKTFLQIGLIALLYGVVMELVQHYFIPFRSLDVGDIVADGIGCVAGYYVAVKYFLKK
jgi:VanZ family protein